MDTYTKDEKESKHNAKVSHQITREEYKRGMEGERPTETQLKQLRKQQLEHVYRQFP